MNRRNFISKVIAAATALVFPFGRKTVGCMVGPGTRMVNDTIWTGDEFISCIMEFESHCVYDDAGRELLQRVGSIKFGRPVDARKIDIQWLRTMFALPEHTIHEKGSVCWIHAAPNVPDGVMALDFKMNYAPLVKAGV